MIRRIPTFIFVILIIVTAGEAGAQSACHSEVTVKPGDTLSGIAARCGTTIQALMSSNPQIEDADLIYPNQIVQIPAQKRASTDPVRLEPRDEPRPQEGIVLRGRLTDEGVECPAVRTADGTLYTLTGDIGALEPGARVRVEGTVAEMSFCMQGTTIAVESIEQRR